MLCADHPNAMWLSELYRGMAAIVADAELDEAQREQRTAAHMAEQFKRISPQFVIHTGGVKLSATGDLRFMQKYGRRRESLCDSNTMLSVDLILADDEYGIVHLVARTTRGDEIMEGVGMGAWRFENGFAVEHWELPNGPKWDAFFLAGDPDFQTDSATEFWTKE